MRIIAAVVLLAGCGRIGFDARSDGGLVDVPTDGVAPDGAMINRCAPVTSAPAMVTISGTTVLATSFGAMLTPEPGVSLTVRNGVNGTVFGGGLSDSAGVFSIPISLAGIPREIAIHADKAGYVTSVLSLGYPVDRDIRGALIPMTNIGGLDSMYGASGVTRDGALGTFVVNVQDCQENPVANAQLSATPAPERVVYADAQGVPMPTQVMTSAAGSALLLNAAVSPSTAVQATRQGSTYPLRTTPAIAGQTIVIMQLVPR